MAPKTRGASYSGAGVKRKRTVRQPAREPSPNPSSSSTQGDSPTPATSSQVDPLANRVITTGRKVDFELFENEGFHVGRQLIEMGFEKICSLDCPTYPALVKEFYKNLSRSDNGLVSVVRGVGLNITTLILSRLLNLQLSGRSTFEPEDRIPALTRLLNRECEGFEEILANQLPLELRLLHNICSRILFPKTGRFDYVSERDVFVMDAIVLGKPLNLPQMMIWYMADCINKKKSSLPYGMIITRIFQSQGVIISDSEPSRKLRHTDYYNLATIHRMGFVKKDGIWERKGQLEVRAADTEAPSVRQSPPVSPSPPAPAPAPATSPAPLVDLPSSSSTKFSDEQLDQIRILLSEQNSEIKSEMKCISEKLDKIASTLDKSAISMSTDLQKIFERLQGVADGSKVYLNATGQLRKDIDIAVQQIEACLEKFKKEQKDDIMEMIGHLKKIVYKHV